MNSVVGRRHIRRELRRPDHVALVDLALHEPGADHRDADPVREQAPAQRVRQPVHRELRRRVDARARAGDERGHRGRVDDVPALAVRLDPGHERDDAVDDAAEVDAEHPVPVLVRRVGDVVEEVDPGVVAEDVDVAEHPLRLVGRARERRRGRSRPGWIAWTSPPSSAVASSRWSARMSAIATCMPAARKAFAMPSPTPLPPPVMNATLPSTSRTPRDLIGSPTEMATTARGRRRQPAAAGVSARGEGRPRARARSAPTSCARSRTGPCSRRSRCRRARASRRSPTASTGAPGGSPSSRWWTTRSSRAPVSGFEFLNAESGWRGLWKTGAGEPADTSALPPEEPFVTRRLQVERDIVGDEYAFLKANAHARAEVLDPGAELAPDLLAPRVLVRRLSDVGRLHRGRRPSDARAHRRPARRARLRLHPDRRAELRAVAHRPGQPRGVRGARPRHGARARRRRRVRQHGLRGPERRHARDAHVPRQRARRHVGRDRRLRGDLEAGLPAPDEPRPAAARVRLRPRRRLRAARGRPAAPPSRARAGDDEGRHARGSRGHRRAGRGGDAVRAARPARAQPAVRFRLRRDRAHDDRSRSRRRSCAWSAT